MGSDQISIIIQAEVAKALAGLQAVNKQIDKTDKVSTKATKTTKSFSNTFLKLGAVVASVAIAYKKVIEPAMAFEETQSKFNTLFRENIEAAEKWADVLVDSYAMSKAEALDSLAAFQAMVKPLDHSAQAAGEMSNQFVQLAADLGSFNNVPTADVVRDLRSALTGSTETVEKYGANIKILELQEFALAEGIIKHKNELRGAAKARAIYAKIVRDTADAQNDMIRTGGSSANILKKLTATFNDAAVSTGQKLLPSLKALGISLLGVAKDGGVVTKAFNVLLNTISLVIAGIAGTVAFLNSFSTDAMIAEYDKLRDGAAATFKSMQKDAIKTFGSMEKFNQEIARGTPLALEYQKGIEAARKEMTLYGNKALEAANANVNSFQSAQDAAKTALDGIQGITKERQEANEKEQAAIDALMSKTRSANDEKKKLTSDQIKAQKEAINKYNEFTKSDYENRKIKLQAQHSELMEMTALNNEQKMEVESAYQEQLAGLKIAKAQEVMQQIQQMTAQFTSTLQQGFMLDQKLKEKSLDKEYQKRKSIIMATVKDEDKQKAALAKLDEEFEGKKRKLKRESAKKEKAIAIATAVINTAAAVVSMLKAGFPVGIVMAALAAAMGVAQIAIIAAQPIPAAAEGALIPGSVEGTLMRAGEKGMSEAIIPLENEEAMDKLAPALGGGANYITLNIENLYATEEVPQHMAVAIDQALLNLKQGNNSAFAESITEEQI